MTLVLAAAERNTKPATEQDCDKEKRPPKGGFFVWTINVKKNTLL